MGRVLRAETAALDGVAIATHSRECHIPHIPRNMCASFMKYCHSLESKTGTRLYESVCVCIAVDCNGIMHKDCSKHAARTAPVIVCTVAEVDQIVPRL